MYGNNLPENLVKSFTFLRQKLLKGKKRVHLISITTSFGIIMKVGPD